jgi:hypothetical protein
LSHTLDISGGDALNCRQFLIGRAGVAGADQRFADRKGPALEGFALAQGIGNQFILRLGKFGRACTGWVRTRSISAASAVSASGIALPPAMMTFAPKKPLSSVSIRLAEALVARPCSTSAW